MAMANRYGYGNWKVVDGRMDALEWWIERAAGHDVI